MSERAVPFHCPYCADEDLRPHGTVHGEWECRACLRAFTLKYIGMLPGLSRVASGPSQRDEANPAYEAETPQEGGPR